MIGKPGSGKSSFVRKNMSECDNVINRDTLKTSSKCIKECEKVMKTNECVIIDNTNPDKKSRKPYLDLAKQYGYKTTAVFVDCPTDIAVHNSYYRSYKTNGDIDIIPTIVYRIFDKNFEKPTIEEFDDVKTFSFSHICNDPSYFYYFS